MPVPLAVAGGINLRGCIVNVIDLRHCLVDLTYHESRYQMGVTVEYHNKLRTPLVDKIGDVVAVAQFLIKKAPATPSEPLRDSVKVLSDARRICWSSWTLKKTSTRSRVSTRRRQRASA